jgi:hypothetical protein
MYGAGFIGSNAICVERNLLSAAVTGYIFRREVPDMAGNSLTSTTPVGLSLQLGTPTYIYLCFAQSQLYSSIELWLLMLLTMPGFPLLAPGPSKKYKKYTKVPCLTWYSVLHPSIVSITTLARYNYALS